MLLREGRPANETGADVLADRLALIGAAFSHRNGARGESGSWAPRRRAARTPGRAGPSRRPKPALPEREDEQGRAGGSGDQQINFLLVRRRQQEGPLAPGLEDEAECREHGGEAERRAAGDLQPAPSQNRREPGGQSGNPEVQRQWMHGQRRGAVLGNQALRNVIPEDGRALRPAHAERGRGLSPEATTRSQAAEPTDRHGETAPGHDRVEHKRGRTARPQQPRSQQDENQAPEQQPSCDPLSDV